MAQLPVDDSAKPPNPMFVLPQDVSAHPAPDPRKCSHQDVRKQQMWRWDMSSSSGEESTTPWGRKTQQVSLHHTASLAECDFILINPSSHLTHTDTSPSDLQRVKPLIPAKISPAGRTPGV